MSPTAEWARLVAGWYAGQDGLARVLFELNLNEARVLDLGDVEACRHHGVDATAANLSWRSALAAGETPPSWTVADRVRALSRWADRPLPPVSRRVACHANR